MPKKNDPEMTSEWLSELNKDHVEHSERLRTLYVAAGERLHRYLLFTNSGAAVAVLGFMGSSPDLRSSHTMWLSLSMFLLGIILCGVLAGFAFFKSQKQFARWVADATGFYEGRIDAYDAYENLNSFNAKSRWPTTLIASSAFLCFVSGVSISLSHTLSQPSSSDETSTKTQLDLIKPVVSKLPTATSSSSASTSSLSSFPTRTEAPALIMAEDPSR